MERFRGRVVLITGASSGIGAALARRFAAERADVVLAARRIGRLQALARDLGAGGTRALAVACDVTRDEDVERAAARARETFGRIDVVVANAGFGVVGSVARLTLDDYRRQFETNVFGVLRTVYATLEDLTRTRGQLVLIGSVMGHISMPGASPYAMSKWAVRALAKALVHELRPRGIAVVHISPGAVVSELRQVDNHGVLRAEVDDPLPRWLRMPTDRAARQIVDAVARRRPERVITRHGKLAVALEHHAPRLLSIAVRLLGARSRGEPTGARAGS
ncbi:MAG TPA: SDR family NAD(P)-dependent oxidoreductase [Methylomirabilota bacterium]|jgi:NADP-dependent 3-hydroxy acid dehydrogenase YdfG